MAATRSKRSRLHACDHFLVFSSIWRCLCGWAGTAPSPVGIQHLKGCTSFPIPSRFRTSPEGKPFQSRNVVGHCHCRSCFTASGSQSVPASMFCSAQQPGEQGFMRRYPSSWRRSSWPSAPPRSLSSQPGPGKRGRSGLCPRRFPVRLARPCRWISRDPFWSRLVGGNNGREPRIFTGVR